MLAALDAHRRAAEIKRMGVLRRFPGVEGSGVGGAQEHRCV